MLRTIDRVRRELVSRAMMKLRHYGFRYGVLRKKGTEDLRRYWEDPLHAGNKPEKYAEHPERSRYLLELLGDLDPKPKGALEVGCNVGRNLHFLQQAGYETTGIELSAKAVAALRETYPALAAGARIINAPAEEALRDLPAKGFDVVFTMAVLVHIPPPGCDGVFREMARVAKNHIITIEDEGLHTERHFPRDYEQIFAPLGFRQIKMHGGDVLDKRDFTPQYVTRIFERR